MRDNGTNGSRGGGAHIRPVSWIRTEFQVEPFKGFKPGEVSPREAQTPATADGYTMQLANPPKWAHRDDLPCVSLVPVAHARDPYDTSDPVKAAQLCAGCPVKQACLDAALKEEHDLSGRSRYLVRGGLTPWGRSELTTPADRSVDLSPTK